MRMLIPQLVLGAIVAVSAAQMPTQAAAGQARGEVAFVTGGVGADEREVLKQMENDFNLKLVFTQPDGHFISDVAVVVKDASGKRVLAEQSGPVFLAKLRPGTYTVESTFDGKTQIRKVTVGKKLTTAAFQFKDVAGDVAVP